MPEGNATQAPSDGQWQVTIFSDPVTSAEYITMTLSMLTGQPREKVTELVMDIHTQGSQVVMTGHHSECSRTALNLAGAGAFVELKKVGASA